MKQHHRVKEIASNLYVWSLYLNTHLWVRLGFILFLVRYKKLYKYFVIYILKSNNLVSSSWSVLMGNEINLATCRSYSLEICNKHLNISSKDEIYLSSNIDKFFEKGEHIVHPIYSNTFFLFFKLTPVMQQAFGSTNPAVIDPTEVFHWPLG